MLFNNDNPFEDRTISSFGISIGTGIALESVFKPTTDRYDTSRVIPNEVDPESYKIHQYNILTIARNILQATPYKDKLLLMNNKYFKSTIQNEVDIITSLYDNIKCDVYFYFPDYVKPYKKYNKDKDIGILKGYAEYADIKGSINTPVIPMKNVDGKHLIFTNIMFDLIDKSDRYHLLESHTGKLKDRSMFNSKYHKLGKNDMSHIPFMDILLYILGDKHMVAIMKLTIRKKLYKISLEKKWNVKTTKAKVISNLKEDSELGKIINDF